MDVPTYIQQLQLRLTNEKTDIYNQRVRPMRAGFKLHTKFRAVSLRSVVTAMIIYPRKHRRPRAIGYRGAARRVRPMRDTYNVAHKIRVCRYG